MIQSRFVLNSGDERERPDGPTSFALAEEAWLRASARLKRFSDPGIGQADRRLFRDPEGIVSVLSRLRRQQRLTQREVETLCRFGDLNRPPDKRVPNEWESAQLWHGALEKAAGAMRDKRAAARGMSTSGKDAGHG
ncbi:hypothetical protein HH303_15305 [Rhodospirillaceae bacterium KN72]|uniref:Uncharacterized protein n=1 Tax=Pacificispira spongiicola TaxID=2729598 RepID=A0A7Y0HGP0_9PROT|nr:hypothetical protein [Pacificispira spongiicola]NMM45863.1 hypothetical protein [Pacificispira spongiicola]